MVRIPCCENMGLKKGPWTPEEDHILVSYIQRFGHGNWRALPRLAGLLRCGKSCRLRWINYLRPDIKRGNFSNEEEETIVKLHQNLGNRWSAIAANLPGRTDNEIKNYWHSHLKKRLGKDKNGSSSSSSAAGEESRSEVIKNGIIISSQDVNFSNTHIERSNCVEDDDVSVSNQELPNYIANVESAVVDGLNNVNDMAFWYDVFMNTGNSR